MNVRARRGALERRHPVACTNAGLGPLIPLIWNDATRPIPDDRLLPRCDCPACASAPLVIRPALPGELLPDVVATRSSSPS